MKEWRDQDCGWYDLFITEIDSENPIATLKDEKTILRNFGLTDYTRIQKVFTGVVQHLIRYSKEI